MTREEGENPSVKVFAPPSFEGVSSVAVLEEIIDSSLSFEVTYTGHVDFRDFDQFKEKEIVIILGLPYKGYNLPEGFYLNFDIPFMDFLHFSTFGQPIEGEHIVSIVNEEEDPIKSLTDYLKQNLNEGILGKYIQVTDKALKMAQAINAYRTWTWVEEGNQLTRMLLALYQSSYKRLPNLVSGKSIQEVVKDNAPMIKGQMEKMNDYIDKKASMVKNHQVEIDGETCLLKVVFADTYINELANDLLMQENTSMPVIVCVGRTTRSNDMFSIRTSKVHAGKIASMINEGNGKESVATVFSGISYGELMGSSIAKQIAESENEA